MPCQLPTRMQWLRHEHLDGPQYLPMLGRVRIPAGVLRAQLRLRQPWLLSAFNLIQAARVSVSMRMWFEWLILTCYIRTAQGTKKERSCWMYGSHLNLLNRMPAACEVRHERARPIDRKVHGRNLVLRPPVWMIRFRAAQRQCIVFSNVPIGERSQQHARQHSVHHLSNSQKQILSRGARFPAYYLSSRGSPRCLSVRDKESRLRRYRHVQSPWSRRVDAESDSRFIM
jgi:hypothetical protein